MGADQTYVCKDNRENATLKNVRSIDDCSPRGLSLQRKADAAHNNANVMQRMAWVATKPLDGNSSSSGGGGFATGSLVTEDALDKKVDENKKRKRLGYNWCDLRRHHRCFVFSPLYNNVERDANEENVMDRIAALKGVERTYKNSIDNNIGYGDDGHGNGMLYSENISNRGFTLQEKISCDSTDDNKLLDSMEKEEFIPRTSKTYKSYSVYFHNCQDWVEDVRDDAGV